MVIHSQLLSDRQSPEWIRIPFVIKGYRPITSNTNAWPTLFRWHNETVNAWTMIASLSIGLYIFLFHIEFPWSAVVPFTTLISAQILHHPVSVCYHILKAQGFDDYIKWRNRDLTMILILNCLTTLALSWFIWGPLWATVATLVVGTLAVHGIRKLNADKHAQRKSIVKYIGLTALGYYVPVIFKGIQDFAVKGCSFWTPTVVGMIGLIVCHFVAGIMYLTHWPERQWPGRFCTLGTSHNWLHVLLFFLYNYAYVYVMYLSRLSHKT